MPVKEQYRTAFEEKVKELKKHYTKQESDDSNYLVYYKNGRKTKTKKPVFCTFDGEGIREYIDGKEVAVYSFLGSSALNPITDRHGITTEAFFKFLFTIDKSYTIVGFFLGYDFENLLKDIPDSAYLFLVNAPSLQLTPELLEKDNWQVKYNKDGHVIPGVVIWNNYEFSWIPKKIFSISTMSSKGKRIYRTVYDTSGFFQTSLESAMSSWHIDVSQEVTEGKRSRSFFTWDDMKTIELYNQIEQQDFLKLINTLYESMVSACEQADLPFRPSSRDFYGPASLAKKFLKAFKFHELYPLLDWDEDTDDQTTFLSTLPSYLHSKQIKYLAKFPMFSAFVGGRIEGAAVGRWPIVYDFDLNSAYPTALSRLVSWSKGNRKCYWALKTGDLLDQALQQRAIGIHLVEWSFPEGWTWYPFPYRAKNGNVFFPMEGKGWISSLELLAACDTLPSEEQKYIKVYASMIVPNTEGYGDGKEIPYHNRNPLSQAIRSVFQTRKELKAKKDGAEKPLKLLLNSLYGLLLRQIGIIFDQDTKFLNDTTAMWITAFTRSECWRAIASHRKNNTVIAIHTDGVLSKEELDVEKGDYLGQWESTNFFDCRYFLPGVYDYYTSEYPNIMCDYPRVFMRRGITRHAKMDDLFQSVYTSAPYTYQFDCFIGRRLALSQPNCYGQYRYQWVKIKKDIYCDLGSKRVGNSGDSTRPGIVQLHTYETEYWTKPKERAIYDVIMGDISCPYSLEFISRWISNSEDETANIELESAENSISTFYRE